MRNDRRKKNIQTTPTPHSNLMLTFDMAPKACKCSVLHSPAIHHSSTYKTELNNLGKVICLRKSEASVGRISVCYGIENLAEHGIHCLPGSYNNDVINM